MRGIYWIWALGLLLKGIGATWDVAWHFRFLREAFTPPHMVNLVGGVLCAAALWYEWQRRDARRTGPLLVVLAGVGLFLLAIPFDQWWHVTFGIDLTTWSPAHLMLFAGTAVSVFGVLLLYVTDLRAGRPAPHAVRAATWQERAMLAYFVVFLVGALYFPLTYNEYTTVAARDAWTAPEKLDPTLVEMVKTLADPVFHNTPTWLYPAYSVAMAAFAGTLLRAWLGRGWALAGLVGLAAERVFADAVLGATGWPTAALPLQFVGMGLALEAAWLAPAPAWARTLAGAVAATALGYAYFANPLKWAPAVPLTAESWPLGLAAAVASALAGLLLARRGLGRVERVPAFEMRDVRAWAQQAWARR